MSAGTSDKTATATVAIEDVKTEDSSSGESKKAQGFVNRFRALVKGMFDDGGVDLIRSGLSEEAIEELKMKSPFTTRELRKLLARFQALDNKNEKSITLDRFLTMGEFAYNPLLERLRVYFKSLGYETLTFSDFVKALSAFSSNTSKESKISALYSIYDCDGDGQLSQKDLKTILALAIGDKIEDTLLKKVVEKVFQELDTENTGFIDKNEFREVLRQTDIGIRFRIIP